MRLNDDLVLSDNVCLATDRDGVIIAVSRGYVDGAKLAGVPEFEAHWMVGASIWKAIPEPLAAFYRGVAQRAFRGELPEYDYACHTPELQRLYHVRVYKLEEPESIWWEHAKFVTEPLLAIEGGHGELERTYRDADGIITQCCHCRKVRKPAITGRWDWVKPFIAQTPRDTSHGMCPSCLEWFYPA